MKGRELGLRVAFLLAAVKNRDARPTEVSDYVCAACVVVHQIASKLAVSGLYCEEEGTI